MNSLIPIGLGVGVLWFISQNTASVPPVTAVTAMVPAVPTTYGINGGYVGNQAASVSNYAALVAANPNLANPNYQLSVTDASTYLANYLDIQQGVALWPGGLSQANLQRHWTTYGCAQKRIFLPLQPPSMAPNIPPVQNKASSGGSTSWIGSAITAAGSIAVAIIGTGEPKMNNAEVQLLVTGSAILKDILPLYRQSDPGTVDNIQARLDDLLNQYL